MPKLNDYEKDALKQKLPEYMAMYGIQLKPNKNILCINPAHNDTTPSMGYKQMSIICIVFLVGRVTTFLQLVKHWKEYPKDKALTVLKSFTDTDRTRTKTAQRRRHHSQKQQR